MWVLSLGSSNSHLLQQWHSAVANLLSQTCSYEGYSSPFYTFVEASLSEPRIDELHIYIWAIRIGPHISDVNPREPERASNIHEKPEAAWLDDACTLAPTAHAHISDNHAGAALMMQYRSQPPRMRTLLCIHSYHARIVSIIPVCIKAQEVQLKA